MLFVNGKRRGLTRFPREEDSIAWYGKVGGKPLPPGAYNTALAAVDPAGNVSERTRPIQVVIRYVALGRNRIAVTAGGTFAAPRLVRCTRSCAGRSVAEAAARARARCGCGRRCSRAASR